MEVNDVRLNSHRKVVSPSDTEQSWKAQAALVTAAREAAAASAKLGLGAAGEICGVMMSQLTVGPQGAAAKETGHQIVGVVGERVASLLEHGCAPPGSSVAVAVYVVDAVGFCASLVVSLVEDVEQHWMLLEACWAKSLDATRGLATFAISQVQLHCDSKTTTYRDMVDFDNLWTCANPGRGNDPVLRAAMGFDRCMFEGGVDSRPPPELGLFVYVVTHAELAQERAARSSEREQAFSNFAIDPCAILEIRVTTGGVRQFATVVGRRTGETMAWIDCDSSEGVGVEGIKAHTWKKARKSRNTGIKTAPTGVASTGIGASCGIATVAPSYACTWDATILAVRMVQPPTLDLVAWLESKYADVDKDDMCVGAAAKRVRACCQNVPGGMMEFATVQHDRLLEGSRVQVALQWIVRYGVEGVFVCAPVDAAGRKPHTVVVAEGRVLDTQSNWPLSRDAFAHFLGCAAAGLPVWRKRVGLPWPLTTRTARRRPGHQLKGIVDLHHVRFVPATSAFGLEVDMPT
jgi:hypothetical protein